MGIFNYFKRTDPERLFGGGNGDSFETAVIINADNPLEGVQAEYSYLSTQCGVPQRDWTIRSQSLREHGGKPHDVITIALAQGGVRTFHFDVSQFFGKEG